MTLSRVHDITLIANMPLEVPWVNHFVAQEAALMVTKRSAQGSRASIEVTRGELQCIP